MTRYHAHPARPALAANIARGVVFGLAAVGLCAAAWAAFVIVWAVTG